MMNPENERDYTLRDYLNIVFRRSALIIFTCAAAISAAGIGLLLKTPAYEAQVKMHIITTDFRSAEMILTQSEIVKSNPVIERAVRRLRYSELPSDYEKQFCSPLKAIVLDIKSKFTGEKLKSLSPSKREEMILRSAVMELKRKIKVEPVKDTNLFTITVTDFSPTNAARIANTVSRSYCIFDLEQQLAEFQQKYGEKHLSVMQLKDNIQKMGEGLSGEALSNIEAIGPASVKIIEQAAAPIKPIESRAAIILILGAAMGLTLGIVLAFAREGLDSTIKSPEDIKTISGIPFLGYIPKKRPLFASLPLILEKIISAFALAFTALISLKALTRWAGSDAANPIVKFIDGVTRPANGYYLITLFAIICLSVLLSKILRLISRGLLKHKLLIKKFSRHTPYLRACQNLAEEIYLGLKENNAKSVLAASVLPQEGTTSILHNLARYLADKAGHKTLLVDANFRRPFLHKAFKVKNVKGLADALKQGIALDELAREINPNLWLITAGKSPVEPINLIDSERLKAILKEAEEKFDIILFDCANIKDFKDAAALSGFAEKIILVVSEGKVKKEALAAALAPLGNKKSNFLGAILNKRTFAIPGMIYNRA